VSERQYTEKQLAALSMADTELAAELYPYLENRPMAKLGLDAYLYEYPKGKKQKLLPIETIPQNQLGSNTRITGFRSPNKSIAQYDYKKDKISMSQKLFRPVDKYESYQEYSERQPMAMRKEQIAILIHELEHRGQGLFYKANPNFKDKVTNVDQDTFHAEIYKGDAETRKKLGLPPPNTYFYDPEKNKYYIRDTKRGYGRKELTKMQAYGLRRNLESQVNKFLKKNPAMFIDGQPRYPSITNKKKRTGGIVNKYARGKKVYTNQGPRKARIR